MGNFTFPIKIKFCDNKEYVYDLSAFNTIELRELDIKLKSIEELESLHSIPKHEHDICYNLNKSLDFFTLRRERVKKCEPHRNKGLEKLFYCHNSNNSFEILDIVDLMCSNEKYCKIDILSFLKEIMGVSLFNYGKSYVLNSYDFYDPSLNQKDYFKEIFDTYLSKQRQNAVYTCYGKDHICLASLEEIINRGKVIKRCEHCNRVFIPQRANEIYCNGESPLYSGKTCKEATKYIKQLEREKGNELAILHKQIYNALRRKAEYYNGLEKGLNAEQALDYFLNESAEWKANIKKGQRTHEEYKKWLLNLKGQKFNASHKK